MQKNNITSIITTAECVTNLCLGKSDFFPSGQTTQLSLGARLLGSYMTHRRTHSVALLRMTDQVVADAATYTTYNKHKRRKSLASARSKPAISVIEPHGHRNRRVRMNIM